MATKKKSFWAPKHVAYVKGLPFNSKMDEIKGFFCGCGDVISITEQIDDKSKWTGNIFE